MSSSPQDQNQEPNQEPKDEMKEEVEVEEKQEKLEETREEKKEEKREGKKEEEKESWGDFIYNPRTGEFLGRTASSWGKTGGSAAQRGARSVGSRAGLTDPVQNRSEPSRDDIRRGSVCVCVCVY